MDTAYLVTLIGLAVLVGIMWTMYVLTRKQLKEKEGEIRQLKQSLLKCRGDKALCQ